jgi:hypothetical protein
MKTNGSTKVVEDADGAAWLVVSTDDGYEAQRLTITERHLFDRSWQAVRFVREHSTAQETSPDAAPFTQSGVHR